MRPTRRARWWTGLLGGLLGIAAVIGVSACSTGGQNVGAGPSPTATASPTIPAPASASPAPAPTTLPAVTPVSVSVSAGGPPAARPLVLTAAEPVSLSIPAIGVTSALSTLGRNADGTVEVPSLDDPNVGAGWFRDSPPPGSLGPSVILGHVDSRRFGPGVFYDLRDLQPGDTVEITRTDGTVAVFAVDSVEIVPKATFPTLRVYGNIDHAGLRLITCGGDFDESARSYDDNVVAFASLVSSR